MKNMFFNYDNNIDKKLDYQHCKGNFSETLPYVKDINGKILGIQAKHQHPITLYFHLDDLGSEYLVINTMTLEELVLSSKIQFEVKTSTEKIVLSKIYDPAECFNYRSNDITISLTQEEMSNLKQESYVMSLKLIWDEDFYELFTNRDGLLIVR